MLIYLQFLLKFMNQHITSLLISNKLHTTQPKTCKNSCKYWTKCVPSCFRKGAQIKSYLISIALITAGFKMYQQIDLYMLPTINKALTMKCVSLYFVYVKISLVHQASTRCVLSSSTRCVFKIYNVTRFKQL